MLFKNALFKKNDLLISGRGGLKYHILNTQDSIGRDLFFDGIYEPDTIRIIEENLSDGDIMIDAGANIGAISLSVAKNNKVTVYAFEPAKNIFEILQKNIDLNHLKNVKTFRQALSDKNGIVDFYESDRVHGWSGMVKIDSFQHYKVSAIALDDFALEQKIDKITVLKIDVQGWEYHVLKGAEKLLDEKRIAHIIFEFEWWAEKNAGLEIGAAQKFLLNKGYTLTTLAGREITEPLTSGTVSLHAKR